MTSRDTKKDSEPRQIYRATATQDDGYGLVSAVAWTEADAINAARRAADRAGWNHITIKVRPVSNTEMEEARKALNLL